MRYSLLDKLECSCGAKEFHVDALVTQRNRNGEHPAATLCRSFCSFKQVKIAAGGISSVDCTECSRIDILRGRISCVCGKVWEVRDGKADFAAKPALDVNEQTLQVVETDFATDPRWNPFVKSHPRGLIYHHSLWLAALRKEFGQESLSLACVDENNELKGIFPMFHTRGLPWGVHRVGGQVTGRRLASLPRTPVAGPLSTSRDVDELLLREAVRRVKDASGTTLQIKMDNSNLDGIIDGMQGTFWRESYVLDLPRDPGTGIRFGNSRTHQTVARAVKKAVRLGVKAREAENEDDLAVWYRLYLETMRRVVVPARPYRFFQELWRKMRPRGMMRLLLAERAGDGIQLLAGSIFLSYGSTVHYAFTGCNALAFSTHANDLLHWEAIHWAQREGYWHYDLGEVGADNPELARFKRKWSSNAVPLYRYHYPRTNSPEARAVAEPSDHRWVREIWQRMPLGLTEVLSSQIFRHL